MSSLICDSFPNWDTCVHMHGNKTFGYLREIIVKLNMNVNMCTLVDNPHLNITVKLMNLNKKC